MKLKDLPPHDGIAFLQASAPGESITWELTTVVHYSCSNTIIAIHRYKDPPPQKSSRRKILQDLDPSIFHFLCNEIHDKKCMSHDDRTANLWTENSAFVIFYDITHATKSSTRLKRNTEQQRLAWLPPPPSPQPSTSTFSNYTSHLFFSPFPPHSLTLHNKWLKFTPIDCFSYFAMLNISFVIEVENNTKDSNNKCF